MTAGAIASTDNPQSDAFFLRGSAVGCLLLHGFSATAHEMRFLGEHLHSRGYTVRGAQLAGHGTSIDDFGGRTWSDWYDSAHQGLVALRDCAPRVVVGQSMGALLAIQLAAQQPEQVAAVVLLSPAFCLSRRWLAWTRPFLPWLATGGRAISKDAGDVADPAARADRRGYRQVPLTALHQLLVLQRRTRRILSRVQQPLLVIHSRQDHTCPLRNVAILESGIARPLQKIILEDSYHVISVDRDKERVAAAVAEFVAQTAKA